MQLQNRIIQEKKYSLLLRSMLITALMFVLTGFCGWAMSFACKGLAESNNLALWLTLDLVMMGGLMVVGILALPIVAVKRPWWVIILSLTAYLAVSSFVFGYLFALLRKYQAVEYGWTAFVAVGGVFLIAALLGKILTWRGIYAFKTFAGFVSGIGSILSIAFFILALIGLLKPEASSWLASQTILNFIMTGSIIIGFVDLVTEIWQLADEETNGYWQDPQSRGFYVFSAVFMMYTCLIALLMKVLILIIRIARNSQRD